MGYKIKICILAAVFLFIALAPAFAAIKSSKSAASAGPEAAYNPHPDSRDLELPMPDGQKLVLRLVPIFSTGPLDDYQFKMGLVNLDESRSIYERQMPAYIGAPFRQENFPRTWQSKFPAEEKDKYSYYLIGKYELSNGQWAAVMGEADGRAELPKTNISWYDVQDFLRKYNEWLLKNHPEAVPTIDGAPAYLRVPTEAEWEYAARWGNPEEQQANPDFPGLGEDQKVEDFAVFGLRYDDKMPIGSRLPNKLGIYDMAGNAAELVQNGFRFAVTDMFGGRKFMRMHGSEGGLLRKGGSYQAKEETEVYPGRREEVRMFEKLPDNTFIPHKTGTLGVRLVLASANVPGPKRENMVLAQDKELSKSRGTEQKKAAPEEKPAAVSKTAPVAGETLVVINSEGDPVAELQKIYDATKSPLVKSNLQQYKELIRGHNEALNRERNANLLGLVRQAAYKADSLSNIAFRCYQLDHELGKMKKMTGQKVRPDVEKAVNANIRRHFKNLQVATNIYRQGVEEAASYPKKVIDDKVLQLRKEYAGEDNLNKAFRASLDSFADHVDFARKNGVNKLNNVMIWKNVIPVEDVRVVVIDLENGPSAAKKRR